MAFGTLLRQYRRAAELTQEVLAERSGLSVDAVSALERGARRAPRRITVDRLAAALGLTPPEREALIASAPSRAARRPPRRGWPDHVPIPPTSLVGRRSELALACRLLQRPHVRLLTLTGTPGVGKTRLGLAVASALSADFTDGVRFVPLAPLTDAGLVGSVIREALGLREVAGQPLLDTLVAHLAPRRTLLLLDNFEHLLPAATQLAELLSGCPELHLLVTSRAVLRIRGEQRLVVPPLPLPHPARERTPAALARVPAVELFVQRAAACWPEFQLTKRNAPAVAEVCRRLDGLPLALELAAPWVSLLPPEALQARLEHRLQVLVGGAPDLPERQQTMRGTLQWSYDLLSADERALFRRLSVFAGGASLEAAGVVCQAAGPLDGVLLDLTGALVDKNLLQRGSGDREPRLAMLETIREFGRELLEASGEVEATARAHAAHYASLAVAADAGLSGPEQAAWLTRLEGEHDNVRAALRWAQERGAIELGLNLAGHLWRFWEMQGHLREGLRWLEELLARTEDVAAPVRAQALNAACAMAWPQSDLSRAAAFAEASLALYRDMGDGEGMARALNNLGGLACQQGRFDVAVELLDECVRLKRAFPDRRALGRSLNNLGIVYLMQGDSRRAIDVHEETLIIRRELGDTSGVAQCLVNLATATVAAGGHLRADALIVEAIELCRDRRVRAEALRIQAEIARRLGREEAATAGYRESLALCLELPNPAEAASCLEGLAAAAVMRQERERATRLYAAAAALREAIGAPRLPPWHEEHERIHAELRLALGARAFSAAWAAGRRLSLDAAAAEAGVPAASGPAGGAHGHRLQVV